MAAGGTCEDRLPHVVPARTPRGSAILNEGYPEGVQENLTLASAEAHDEVNTKKAFSNRAKSRPETAAAGTHRRPAAGRSTRDTGHTGQIRYSQRTR